MRLFVAFEVPEGIRRQIVERVEPVRPRLPGARWVDPRNLHLTLAFLGERPPEAVRTLDKHLREAFTGKPLRLKMAGPGTFPPRTGARVAWVGFEPNGELMAVQARVAAAVCQALETEPERRPFHAHLTLARCRPPWPRRAVEKFEGALADGDLGEFTATTGLLFESRLHSDGAEHRVVSRYPLEQVR